MRAPLRRRAALPLVLVTGLALVFVLAGCGGAAALQAAQGARYRGDRSEMLERVNQTVQAGYEVVDINLDTGKITTRERWYEEDGTFESKSRVESGRHLDRSIILRYEVTLRYDGPEYMVDVTPVAGQIRSGYSALFPLRPGDPQMPNWIMGKTENLIIGIDQALAPYRTATGR